MAPINQWTWRRGRVIVCVWELAVIDAEQKIWRETMMGDKSDLSAYLATRVSAAFA